MTTMTIKKIDAIQCGKVMAVLTALTYLIAGILMTLFLGLFSAMLYAIPGMNASALVAGGVIGGLIMTVVMVIFGLIFGFISGIICAWIYNVVAGMVGGIKLDLE